MGPYVTQLLELIVRNGLDRPPHIDRYPVIANIINLSRQGMLREYLAKTWIPTVSEIINEITIRPNVTLVPDPDRLHADGPFEVELGTTENELRYGCRPLSQEVSQTLVAGATGTGKSVLLRSYVIRLCQLFAIVNKPLSVIVIDPKADYRDLPKKAGGDWLVMDAGSTLRVGQQNPEGVPEDSWINIVATSFAARCGLVAGRISVSKIIRWLRETMRDRLGRADWWPDWRLVLEVLRAAPRGLLSSKDEYSKSVEQNLVDIVEHTGQLVSCFSGLDVVRDVINKGRHIVIAMERLTIPWIRAMLFDLLVSQIFFSRLYGGRKVSRAEVVIVVDEGDEFFSARQELAFPSQISPGALMLKQGRELGISTILSVSVLSNVSPMVLANTADQYMFNQANADSLIAASKTLLLGPGGETTLSNLKPGQFIARQSLSSYPRAVWVQGDYVEPYRGAPPPFDSHDYIPSQPLSKIPPIQEALKEIIVEHWQTRHQENKAKRKELSDADRQLLDLASLHPFWPVARLWDQLSVDSPSKQRDARKTLSDREFAEFTDVRISKANIALTEITSGGWEFLGKAPPALKGKGGIEHRHYQNWIAMVGKKRGYEAHVEWPVPGTTHAADAAWLVNGRWQCFEVVVGEESNLISHIKACLIESSVVDTVTIVSEQLRLQERLREGLEEELTALGAIETVKFQVIQAFMDELWP